jgi:DNA transformation protein
MSCDEVFVEFLLELFAPLGDVTSKRMFGGYGFFMDGLMFGLVAESTLYLKTDEENKALFENKGLEPFIYEKTNKNVVMSYYQSPEDAVDSSDAMAFWAKSAFAAAKRTKERKSAPGKRPEVAVALPLDTEIDSALDIDLDVADADGFDDDSVDLELSIGRD